MTVLIRAVTLIQFISYMSTFYTKIVSFFGHMIRFGANSDTTYVQRIYVAGTYPLDLNTVLWRHKPEIKS
jgi:hypothetical protein